MSQRPSSGGSEVVLPLSPSDPSRTLTLSQATPPSKRRVSTSSTTSLASLLTRLHPHPTTALSLEGKLRVRATVDCGSDVLCCKFSHDGSLLAAACRSGQVRVYTATGSLSHTLPFPSSPPKSDPGVPKFDPSGVPKSDPCVPKSEPSVHMSDPSVPMSDPSVPKSDPSVLKSDSNAGPSDSSVSKLDSSLPQCYPEGAGVDVMVGCRRRPQPAATSLLWLPRGDSLLTTYSDGRAVVWDGRSEGVSVMVGGVDVKAAMGGEGQVICYTPDHVTLRDPATLAPVISWDTGEGGGLVGGGRVWAVCGRGKEVIGGGRGLTWWDGRSGRVIRKVGGVHIRGPALAPHPHTPKLLCGNWGGGGDAVQVWDAASGRLTHVLHSDATNTAVWSAVWAGRETVAVGGADPNLMRLATLDNTTVGVVKGLREGVWGLDASPTRPHQVPRLALSSGASLYLMDVLK